VNLGEIFCLILIEIILFRGETFNDVLLRTLNNMNKYEKNVSLCSFYIQNKYVYIKNTACAVQHATYILSFSLVLDKFMVIKIKALFLVKTLIRSCYSSFNKVPNFQNKLTL